jgi:hypothetical protein
MNVSIFLGLLAIIFALGSVYTGVRMAYELRARGIPANPALVRWMIFKYMTEYRRVTLKETGQVGPLFHACATVSALAALFAIGAILTMVI